jgi:purine catabolism regulator
VSISSTPSSAASVHNILTLLASREVQLVGGAEGLERRVTWATRMRTRLPAFESIHGGELALLALTQLRRIDETLPHLLKSLHQEGISAVAVAASSLEALGNEAPTLADQLQLPLLLLPASIALEVIEREIITFVVSFRGEIERSANEISHQLMQLSIQGTGLEGIAQHLARSCDKWVVIEDTEHYVRLQAAPSNVEPLSLPAKLSDQALSQRGLARIAAPISIRHTVVGFLSLLSNSSNFDYLDRILLGQVVPVLALEFAREKERSEVEGRYQLEAFMDVLQGTYQQPEEMLARARILGYELTQPQVVVVLEIPQSEPHHPSGSPYAQWSKRLRDELLLAWPSAWVMTEQRRVTALLPLTTEKEGNKDENTLLARLERVHSRLRLNNVGNVSLPPYSGGMGRIARNLVAIPQSYREAQRALEIGQQLFGGSESTSIHSFARLGIYRLLFHIDNTNELQAFYQETLGPLLNADTRGDGTLLETLEGFFRCNGNLSEAARTMHLHRNSLLYRLGRIEEILDRSLEDPELRLSLQIALKIHHLGRR